MPITKRQVEGIVALVVITALIYVFNFLTSLFPPSPIPLPVPYNGREAGMNAVALAIDGNDKGVFFLPREATVSDLLTAAEVAPLRQPNSEVISRRLSAGDKVFLTSGSSSIVCGKMPAAQALALDLPININLAAFDDLILVPGIGEKTAEEIIVLREKKGGFRSVEELMEIRGVKEKKWANLRKYFYVASRVK